MTTNKVDDQTASSSAYFIADTSTQIGPDPIYDDPAGNAILGLGGPHISFRSAALTGVDNGLFYTSNTATYESAYQEHVFLARIDPDLTSTQQVLLDSGSSYSPALIGDAALGGVAVVKDGSAMTLLDSELNISHALTLGSDNVSAHINAVDAGSDRTVAAGYESGEGDGRDAYIVSLNADASVHAEFHFDDLAVTGSDEAFSDLLVLADNSVLAWNDNQLFKFDQDLTLQKALEFDTSLASVVERPDGSLLALDDSLQDVFRLDAGLNVTDAWQGARDFGPGQFNIFPNAADFGSDELTIAAGRSYQSGYSVLSFDLDDFAPGSTSVGSIDAKSVDASYLVTTANVDGRSVSLGSDRETLYVTDPADDSAVNASQGSIAASDFSYAMTAVAATEANYPAAQSLDWSASEISLVGIGNDTAVHISDGLTLSA